MVKAFACDSRGREFNSRPFRSQASCSHTCASVTKQYNLVPVARQPCSATGKVTVGLASQWPCVTDLWFIHLRAHGLSKGDEHTTNTPHGVWYSLPFYHVPAHSRSVLSTFTVSRLADIHQQARKFFKSILAPDSCLHSLFCCLHRVTKIP